MAKFEMTWTVSKIAFLVALIVCILGLSYIGAMGLVEQFSLKNKLIEEQIVVLKKNVVSQKIDYNSYKLEKKMDELDIEIKALAKARNQEITDIGKSIAELKQTVNKKKPSDHIYKKGSLSDHEFVKIYAKDAEGKEFPVAWAMFQPNKPDGERWKTGTYPLEYHNEVVIMENAERADSVVKAYMMNNQMKETKGKMFPIEITSVDWIKREKQTKEWFYNPRLSLGISVGDEVYPNLSCSFFSYGRTKRDMDWRFLSIGGGFNEDLGFFQFTPVEYNLGEALPLIENLFIGPYFSLSSDSEWSFGGALNLPF